MANCRKTYLLLDKSRICQLFFLHESSLRFLLIIGQDEPAFFPEDFRQCLIPERQARKGFSVGPYRIRTRSSGKFPAAGIHHDTPGAVVICKSGVSFHFRDMQRGQHLGCLIRGSHRYPHLLHKSVSVIVTASVNETTVTGPGHSPGPLLWHLSEIGCLLSCVDGFIHAFHYHVSNDGVAPRLEAYGRFGGSVCTSFNRGESIPDNHNKTGFDITLCTVVEKRIRLWPFVKPSEQQWLYRFHPV